MASHASYPELADLPAKVKQQRRLVAGTLRIVREDKALRAEMDALLAAAGVQSVECEGYEVRRSIRDGERIVLVTPIKTDA